MASIATLRLLTLALLGAFVALLVAAAYAYPGAPAFDWARNYWCDLLHERAAGGASNALGAALAKAGFAALGASLVSFWLVVSTRAGKPNLVRFVAVAGALSAMATAAVGIVPSDRYPALHPPLALLAGGVGFVCTAISIVAPLGNRRATRLETLFGLPLLAAAALNIVLYVNAAYLGGSPSAALPAVQKVATLLLLGWMGSALGAAGNTAQAR